MRKFLDENGLLYLWGKIKGVIAALETALAGKVDAVDGKGLSANDYTNADKNKLDGLENYTLPVADVNQLGGIMVLKRDAAGLDSDYMGGAVYFVRLSNEGLARVEIPYSSQSTAGIVKVGAGLSISNGVLSVTGGTAAAASVDWSDIQNKPEVALKSDLSSVYRFKGSVINYASLPAEGNETGDVWNVESTGMNYAWNGEAWDALGESIQIESIANTEIDTIIAG